MASIGHVAVGLLIGRAYEARSTKERIVTMGAFGAAGLLPDADAALVAFGSDYHGHFGHRGFTHSLIFVGLVSVVAFFLARRFGTRPWLTAVLAALAVGSHGVLDAMTYRTRGIPFLWPFSEARFTLPWRMIPPAPFGEHFLSRRGFDVMMIELLYFLPVTMVALGPSLAACKRALRRLASWFTPPTQALIPAVAPALSHRRAVARVLAIFLVTTFSLTLAEFALKDSRAVAYLESAHDQTLAVSLQRNPRFQHLR